MIRVLLDTHALLWALAEPAKLSRRARTIMTDITSEIVVSSVSAFEIARKHQLGKLTGADAVLHGYGGHVRRLGATEVGLSGIHALLAARLPGKHRDPFDRFIAAQSLVEDLPVITRDEAIADLGAETIW